jgi:hypothetical protein
LHCLILLLLPAADPKNLRALPQPHSGSGQPAAPGEPAPLPYLPVLGAPALRFQLAPLLPDLSTRPASGAPPLPALSPIETTVAQANLVAAHSTAPATPSAPQATGASADNAKAAPVPAPAGPAKAPAPIIPDESRPSVRPEDFLPYFEIPGAGQRPGTVNVIMPGPRGAPAPGALPPSSATYTQTQK